MHILLGWMCTYEGGCTASGAVGMELPQVRRGGFGAEPTALPRPQVPWLHSPYPYPYATANPQTTPAPTPTLRC